MNIDKSYYRCIKAFDEDLSVGTLYLASIEKDCVRIRRGHHYLDMNIDEFNESFVHEPNGMAARMSEGITPIENETTDIEISGMPTDLLAPETTNAIVGIRQKVDMQISAAEHEIEKIEAIAYEMVHAAQDKLAVVQRSMRNIEAVLNGLNMYLGTGETVVTLRHGERASADVPTIIRQLVLFADEECACAANALTGGIDARQIHQFDEWLLTGNNIDAVIPEPRCIVALRPRREEKNYVDDKLTNAFLNRDNFDTFFLVRNGECIYRVHPEMFHQSELLFPTNQEMYDVMEKSNLLDRNGNPIPPGTKEWVEAAKGSDAMKRGLLTTVMFLQSLFDRSDLLHPLDAKVNVAMPDERYIRIVRDGEMTLSDGRPKFYEWLREVNSRIRVGSRVAIDTVEARKNRGTVFKRIHSIEDRIFQVTELNSNKTYEEYFCKFYGTNWRGKRVSDKLMISPDDGYIIDVNNVTEEDIRYYLSCRIQRHQYLKMFPLLYIVLELKEAERARDEDFIRLTASQIAKSRNEDVRDVDVDIVRDLTAWWKYKNQMRRAVDDDAPKALRMIIKNFGTRKKRWHESAMRPADEVEKLMENLRSQSDFSALLYVGYCGDNEYVGLYNTDRPDLPFVREIRIRSRLGSFMKHERNANQVVGWRHATWVPVFETEAWKKFDHWAEDRSVLSPEDEQTVYNEINLLVQNARNQIPCDNGDIRFRSYDQVTQESVGFCYVPISCCIQKRAACMYVQVTHFSWDESHPLTVDVSAPKLMCFTLSFEKNAHGKIKCFNNSHGLPSAHNTKPIEFCNKRDIFDRGKDIRSNAVWVDDAAYASWVQEWRDYQDAMEVRQAASYPVHEINSFIGRSVVDQTIANAKAEHDLRLGSATAWKSIEKKLRQNLSNYYESQINDLLETVFENNDYRAGETVEDMFKRMVPDFDASTYREKRKFDKQEDEDKWKIAMAIVLPSLKKKNDDQITSSNHEIEDGSSDE